MNKQGRKELASVAKRLSKIMGEISVTALKLSDLRDEINSVCEEHTQATVSDITCMEEATSALDDLINALDNLDVQSIIDDLEGAAE
jgi:hypothetical protein